MNSVNSSRKKNRVRESIDVGGITPFTTIDYPGQLAAVLFLQGCPWRCHYCHNSELISRRAVPRILWSSVLDLLDQRRQLLDAVVFSGGEPTLQSGLAQAMRQVKTMGFKIGLHTAGAYPERLERLLPWIDWVGLDIKASIKQYPRVTGVKKSGECAWQSLRLIVGSGLDYEVRTTIHPNLMDRDQMYRLTNELISFKVAHFVVQECVPDHCLNPDYRLQLKYPFNYLDIQNLEKTFINFELRKAS